MTAIRTRVRWQRTHRLINSAFPPIDLFEDIADPADWAPLNGAEQKTNPRLAATIGNLDLVPEARRVGGTNSSYVMAPFTHVSPDRPGRFHNGTFGAYYAGNSFETALFETIYHTGKFCAATNEDSGWIADMRELIGSIDARLVDIRQGEHKALLDPDSYAASQTFAVTCRSDDENGIVYPSVRHPGGHCFAALYPDVMSIPVQGAHVSYYWNGERVSMLKHLTGDRQVFEIEP